MANAAFELELQTMASEERDADMRNCQAVKQHGPNKWELLMMGQLLPFLLEQIPFLLRIATLLKLLMNIRSELWIRYAFLW
uniref:Uncharacterized protein n=2 Tax=Oryza TaxID=4527 RepID=A0A0E0Q3S3_ORYRU